MLGVIAFILAVEFPRVTAQCDVSKLPGGQTLLIRGSNVRKDLMGGYKQCDDHDGKAAFVLQSTYQQPQYLYWLHSKQQWNIGTPLGYNGRFGAWMYSSDTAATPADIRHFWHARPGTNPSKYSAESSITVKAGMKVIKFDDVAAICKSQQ
jgi:hypothetical protein